MAFWRKKSPLTRQPGPPDEAFPYLSAADADRIRGLTYTAFAQAGTEVDLRLDHALAADGRVFGLANVVATCHNDKDAPNTWPAIVQRHVTTVLRVTSEDSLANQLNDADLLTHIYLRVTPTEAMTPELWADAFSYTRELAADLRETLALDLPESVAMLRDEDVAGHGVQVLRDAGLENLLREPHEHHQWVSCPDVGGFWLVMGDSVYTASRLLVLRDVLGRVTGSREHAGGVIVGLPARHQLVLLPLSAGHIATTFWPMCGFVADGYVEGVAAISPHLYWWRSGELTRLTYFDAQETVRVRVPQDLAAILAAAGETLEQD